VKFVLITRDQATIDAAKAAFPPSDQLLVFENWTGALDACEGADMLFVDLVATLDEPHKIAGYEAFAMGKMAHEEAKLTPLVLISPPEDYELDFMVGWPDFVFAFVRKPVTDKIFRRASTWV